MKTKFHRHVAAVARDLWVSKNRTIYDPSTLGNDAPGVYLANRIDRAFADGWDAAERHYKHQAELRGIKLQ